MEYQTTLAQLIAQLHSDPETRLNRLPDFLDARYAHRLLAYSDSYSGRVIQSLTTTVLTRVQTIFGTTVIQQLLWHFFRQHPPEHVDLAQAIKGFPQFIYAHARDTTGELIAAACDCALQRWELLQSPDPLPAQINPEQWQTLRLRQPYRWVLSPNQYNLYALWETSPAATFELGAYPSEPYHVLMFKPEPLVLKTLPIPGDLTPFLQALTRGETLEAALEALTLNHNTVDMAQVEQLIAALIQDAALTHPLHPSCD